MIEILEELHAASSLLQAALDRYRSVCSALKVCYISQRNASSRTPQELSRRVTDELQLIGSYETAIGEAKAAISLTRNSCADIVPINSLPDEILSRIFHLLLDAQLRATGENLQPISLNYVDTCSLVCSRWRLISTSLGTLWSRIDLSLSESSERCLARAMVYAGRASCTLVDIRISDDTYHSPLQASGGTLVNISPFLASIAPRIKSLVLEIYAPPQPYLLFLRTCFASCIPGVLTRLVLDVRGYYHFLEAAESSLFGMQTIDVPKQLLEDLWHPITVLRVSGLYPHWSSKAYHGLTRLHLSGHDKFMSIPEQQLIEISKSSPQLRAFCFGLKITNQLPTEVSIVLAQLEYLGVSDCADQPGVLLRLLAPGSKPLQVSINQVEDEDTALLNEMKRFFARSNVTKLYMSPMSYYSTLTSALLDLLPPLEVLALKGYSIRPYKPHTTPEHPTSGPSPLSTYAPCFQTLQLIDCHTHLDELRRAIEKHSVQTLRIQLGSILSDPISDSLSDPLSDSYPYQDPGIREEVIEQLHAILPGVKSFSWTDSGLIEDWTEVPI